jgi:hypothetical protein
VVAHGPVTRVTTFLGRFGNLMLSNIGNIQSMSCDADHRLCFGLFIATLVEFVLANEASHDLIDGPARPFLLAVFGECQLVAENLHAAEWVSRAMIKAVD